MWFTQFVPMSSPFTNMDVYISNILSTSSALSLVLTSSAVFISLIYFITKNKNLPPGPIGLPYFGYWPFLKNENITGKLEKLKKKYGDVFSLTINGRLFINLGSIKAVREAFVTKADHFDRQKSGFRLIQQFYDSGLSSCRGEMGLTLRKFYASVFKERAAIASKNYMIGPVYETIKSTISSLKETGGKPVNFAEFLPPKCVTMIRLTIFGGVGVTDEQLQRIADLHQEGVKAYDPLNFLLSGIVARYYLFYFKNKYRKALENHIEIDQILTDIVKEHESTYDEEKSRDLIDDYLKERASRRNKRDPTAKYFTNKSLVRTLGLLVPDGVMNVSFTISVVLNHLIQKPEEQQKIYEQILEVVGKDRQPTVEDKSKLPYLNAFVLEVLRTSTLLPVLPSDECIKETTLNGHMIPKGAVVMMNFFSCNNDPELFEEPRKFNASRFVPTEGKSRAELPMVFGAGRRSCLGEGYTMMLTFLFLATIIQNFEFKYPHEMSISSHEIVMQGNLPVCFHPRSQS